MVCDNLSVNSNRLLFAGQDACDLAEKYGTPLYLMDEERIRRNCRMYTEAFRQNFPEGSMPLYASKACAFKQMFRIVAEENMGIDVVSPGEIHTALKAGFNMARAYYHGNVKTAEDIRYAMDCGVGFFVVDNCEELLALEAEASSRGCVQSIYLRLTPGIDPHTYEKISTGKVDSKFGAAIETGQAEELCALALKQEHLLLAGVHCHVGSMVFYEDVYERASDIMLKFMADIREKYGFEIKCLDLGGGYGVRYLETDPYVDIPRKISELAAHMRDTCAGFKIEMPVINMEPGRSIVADAGLTLYTVGGVKRIPGYKNYVAIDGGMGDNPRYTLYEAKYTCLAANRMDEIPYMHCSLVGRYCESGDIVCNETDMPESIRRGDVVAVCTTGAYNYSMAFNYNRVGRPPVVMLKDGESYIAVKRESLDDLILNDV